MAPRMAACHLVFAARSSAVAGMAEGADTATRTESGGEAGKDAAQASALSTKAAKGAGWVIAWRLASRNLGLISSLILARLLTPADFGLVAIATGFIAAVDGLSAFSLQDALVREPALDRELYDTAFTMNLFRGLASAGIVALAAWPLGDFFGDRRLSPVLLALAAGTFLTALENIGIVDFYRDLAFDKEFWLQIAGRIVGVIVTVALAVALRSYWALVAGILAGHLVRLVQSYTMSRYRPRLGLRQWRRIIAFSLWNWGSSVIYMARDPLDRVIIGRMLGASAAGIFSLGVEIGFLPNSELAEPLYRALFSAFSEAGRNGLSSARAYLRVVPAALLLTIPAAVGISLVADPLIRLALGPHWLGAVPLVWIVAIPAGLTVIGQVTGAALNAAGMPHVIFRISAISIALKLPFVVGLVWEFGLVGGAAGFALWTLTEQLLYFETSRRRFGVRLGALAHHTWRSIFATAVMAAVLFECGLGWTQTAGDVIAAARVLFTAAALGAAIYAVVLIGAWVASGRPDGPEIAVWSLTQSILRRLRPQIGPARRLVGSD